MHSQSNGFTTTKTKHPASEESSSIGVLELAEDEESLLDEVDQGWYATT